MKNYLDPHQSQPAARLVLEALDPLCGLDVDASRVALLQSLVESLLQHGERLARTTDLAVEPFFIAAAGRPSNG